MIQYQGENKRNPRKSNMQDKGTEIDRVYQEVVRRGLLRSCDLQGKSDRMHLSRLYEQGKIKRIARGVYASSDKELSAASAMAVVSLKIPKGVICLVSALNYYDITTQVPWEVWVAIPDNSVTPRIPEHQVKYVWFSDKMLKAGVDMVTVDDVPVRIFSPAKTIADCFKYRNKIGMEVCLDALQEGWKRRLFSMDDLWKYSKICRVRTVIRPYLEVLK